MAEVYMDGYGWVTVEVTPQASAQGSTGAATEAGASFGEGQNIQQELQTESPSEVSTDGQELTQDAAGQPLEQRTDSVPEISQVQPERQITRHRMTAVQVVRMWGRRRQNLLLHGL